MDALVLLPAIRKGGPLLAPGTKVAKKLGTCTPAVSPAWKRTWGAFPGATRITIIGFTGEETIRMALALASKAPLSMDLMGCPFARVLPISTTDCKDAPFQSHAPT